MNTKPKTLSKNQFTRIGSFLKALPHLEFTETGLKNIAKRFRVDVAVIKQLAVDLEAMINIKRY